MNKNPFLVIAKLIVDSNEFDEAMEIINYLMLKEDDENLAKENQLISYHQYINNYSKSLDVKEETDFIKMITHEITKYNKKLNNQQKQTLLNFIEKYNIDLFKTYHTYQNNDDIYEKNQSLLMNIIHNESLFSLFAENLLSNSNTKEKFIDYINHNDSIGILIENNFYESLKIIKKYNVDVNISATKNYPIFNINNYQMYEFLNTNFTVNWNVKDIHGQSILQYIANNKENDLLIKNLIEKLKQDDSFNEQIGAKIFHSIYTHTNKKDIIKLIDSYEGDIKELYDDEGDNIIMACVKRHKYPLAYELYHEHNFDPEFKNKEGKNLLNYIIKDYKIFKLAKTIEEKKHSLIKTLITHDNVLNNLIADIMTTAIDNTYKDNYCLSTYISPEFIMDKIKKQSGNLFDSDIETIKKEESSNRYSHYNTYWSDKSMIKLFSFYQPLKAYQFKKVYNEINELLNQSVESSKEDTLNLFISETQKLLTDKNILDLYKNAMNDENNKKAIQDITSLLTQNYSMATDISINLLESVNLINWCDNLGIEHLSNDSIFQLTEMISKIDSLENYKNANLLNRKVKLEQEVLNRNTDNNEYKSSRKIKI
jgi:hypothetical protein